MPVNPELGRLRQERHELKANLNYRRGGEGKSRKKEKRRRGEGMRQREHSRMSLTTTSSALHTVLESWKTGSHS